MINSANRGSTTPPPTFPLPYYFEANPRHTTVLPIMFQYAFYLLNFELYFLNIFKLFFKYYHNITSTPKTKVIIIS